MNNNICEVLQRMYELRVSEKEIYKAKAYQKAINSISNYNKKIISGDEAKKLPGVGESISKKIDEILTTGTLKEIESVADKQKVIKLFTSIEMVGPKKAEEWYELGYRQINQIPKNKCTDNQWICIQLYDELIQKIPRSEIKVMDKLLSAEPIKYKICGSYRRQTPTSGDIDILVIDQPNVIDIIIQMSVFVHTLGKGDKKYLGIGKIDKLHRRIDIEVVKSNEYPFALVYFTGPGNFNIKMRQHCIELGLRLNEKSLINQKNQLLFNLNRLKQSGATHTSGGLPLDIPDLNYDENNLKIRNEKELFKLLGLKYLSPKERHNYDFEKYI